MLYFEIGVLKVRLIAERMFKTDEEMTQLREFSFLFCRALGVNPNPPRHVTLLYSALQKRKQAIVHFSLYQRAGITCLLFE